MELYGLDKIIGQFAGLHAAQIAAMMTVPPNSEMGDVAFPCFRLAKQLGKSPQVIADELLRTLKLPPEYENAEIAGGYLNFYFDRNAFCSRVLKNAVDEYFGSAKIGAGKTIVIDYSSINVAKPFHIGHLSSTAIGNSLYRIHKFLGYNVIGVNHLGDWGTQFGKLIVAYKKWHKEGEDYTVEKLTELYVRFHEEASSDETLNDEAREWFKKIEAGNEQATELFAWFKELTLAEVGKVYDLLGVQFDYYMGESFFADKTGAVVEELRQKNLLTESDGAYVVELDDMPPCLILKSDGATLYATRDLATAEYRKKTWNFHKNLYVVAYQQSLHFKQVFACLEKMGYDWAGDCEHVAFGMVSLKGEALSTRKGNVVLLKDVLAVATQKSLQIIEEKSPDLADKNSVAQAVGVGAVVFSALSSQRIKDITFDWETALNFDGETGPYIQYTYARTQSLLKKAPKNLPEMDNSVLNTPLAFEVLKRISEFAAAVLKAHDKYEPYLIARQLTWLCSDFNRYYFEQRIIDDDFAATAARLELAKCVGNVIKTGLTLLGIEAPERM